MFLKLLAGRAGEQERRGEQATGEEEERGKGAAIRNARTDRKLAEKKEEEGKQGGK